MSEVRATKTNHEYLLMLWFRMISILAAKHANNAKGLCGIKIMALPYIELVSIQFNATEAQRTQRIIHRHLMTETTGYAGVNNKGIAEQA